MPSAKTILIAQSKPPLSVIQAALCAIERGEGTPAEFEKLATLEWQKDYSSVINRHGLTAVVPSRRAT